MVLSRTIEDYTLADEVLDAARRLARSSFDRDVEDQAIWSLQNGPIPFVKPIQPFVKASLFVARSASHSLDTGGAILLAKS